MNTYLIRNEKTHEQYLLDSVYHYYVGELIHPIELGGKPWRVIKATIRKEAK